MFKTHYNKVYNYVQNRSAFEIFMDGVCASLFVLAMAGFTNLTYHIINSIV
jgi:hypothetical protein